MCAAARARTRGALPRELLAVGDSSGVDSAALVEASRLVAKIDSAAVQDGYDLYLHAFFATKDGRWCVVQQGMNPVLKEARRYHWQSENLGDLFASPHAAIEGHRHGPIVNLADVRAARNRAAELELVRSGPDRTLATLRQLREQSGAGRALSLFPETESVPLTGNSPQPHLQLPHHHHVAPSDVMLRRLRGTLAAAADRGPKDFAELLLTPGVGARTVAALAFVAEVVHGARHDSQIPRVFPWRMAEKTVIRFRCRSECSMPRSGC